jgi:hypothetical protein
VCFLHWAGHPEALKFNSRKRQSPHAASVSEACHCEEHCDEATERPLLSSHAGP